jgi:hypothetical protein
MEKNIYIKLWTKLLPKITAMLENADSKPQPKQLPEKKFTKVGKRAKSGYSFDLVLNKTEVANNIDNSAVARDLDNVLRSSPKAIKILQNGNYRIKMKYYLTIQKL